jgi:integrase/recombinase XerD
MTRQVDSYLDHMAVERGAARNTLGSYRRDLERYTQFLADRGVTDIGRVREQDVRNFVIALRTGDPTRELPPLAASSAARAAVEGTTRTRSGTRSRHICWTAARTFGWSKSCWGMLR